MLTPPETLVLVHAVEKPLLAPVVDVTDTGMQRILGDTFCALAGSIDNHAKSTGRLDVDAVWNEQRDDVGKDLPDDGVDGRPLGARARARRRLPARRRRGRLQARPRRRAPCRDEAAGPPAAARVRRHQAPARPRTTRSRRRGSASTSRPRSSKGVTRTASASSCTAVPRTSSSSQLAPARAARRALHRPDLHVGRGDAERIALPAVPRDHDRCAPAADGAGGTAIGGVATRIPRTFRRTGGGVAACASDLRRGWFSSGDGEQLGVVLKDQPWLTWPIDITVGMEVGAISAVERGPGRDPSSTAAR